MTKTRKKKNFKIKVGELQIAKKSRKIIPIKGLKIAKREDKSD